MVNDPVRAEPWLENPGHLQVEMVWFGDPGTIRQGNGSALAAVTIGASNVGRPAFGGMGILLGDGAPQGGMGRLEV